MQFDFDKLPENQYERVARAIIGHDTGTLVLIHQKYELSEHRLCCSGQKAVSDAYELFEFWSIKKGLIEQ